VDANRPLLDEFLANARRAIDSISDRLGAQFAAPASEQSENLRHRAHLGLQLGQLVPRHELDRLREQIEQIELQVASLEVRLHRLSGEEDRQGSK